MQVTCVEAAAQTVAGTVLSFYCYAASGLPKGGQVVRNNYRSVSSLMSVEYELSAARVVVG